jgi:hypothetical protein
VWAVGIAGGTLILGVAFAGPALGQSWFGGQPAPGTPAQKVTEVAPVPEQPPGDAKPKPVTEVAPVPEQPVNEHPVAPGPSTKLRHSKGDEGEKGLPPQKDLGKKNLPVQRDLGDVRSGR